MRKGINISTVDALIDGVDEEEKGRWRKGMSRFISASCQPRVAATNERDSSRTFCRKVHLGGLESGGAWESVTPASQLTYVTHKSRLVI